MSFYVTLGVMGTKIYRIKRYKVKKYHNNELKITIMHWVLWAYQPIYLLTELPTYKLLTYHQKALRNAGFYGPVTFLFMC